MLSCKWANSCCVEFYANFSDVVLWSVSAGGFIDYIGVLIFF